MKAFYFEEHGERDVLQYGDLPDLKIKENHVLIKVEACTLNHLNVWIRKGWPGLNLKCLTLEVVMFLVLLLLNVVVLGKRRQGCC